MNKILNCLIILFMSCQIAWAGWANTGNDRASDADFAYNNYSNATCAAWVYHTSTAIDNYIAAHSDPSEGFLFLRDNTGATARTDIYTVLIYCSGGNYRVETATNSSPLNEWTHVAWVFDSDADTLRFYIDGVEDANSPNQDGAGDIINAADDFEIGNSDGGAYFIGTIGEIAFWSGVSLTAQEISILANSRGKRMPLQIQPSYLQLYFPFDDGRDGESADGDKPRNLGTIGGTGDISNGTTSTWTAETYLTYP